MAEMVRVPKRTGDNKLRGERHGMSTERPHDVWSTLNGDESRVVPSACLWNEGCCVFIMPAMQLTVNGAPRQYQGDPQMPLLWYLRDLLRLTGTKFGCGIGLCGACTVHVNGEAQRSCVTSMSNAAGKEVVTIEALNAHGEHPVQQAWKQINVPQCGYCQSGQIMQAVALLKQKPAPTDQDIDEIMQGNICRCGTYQRIRQAIHIAAGRKA
jgi:isoquinoline 1-oxidoreductase subunit alpha